ncbi:MAG: RING finger protein [Pirellulaceae bacterium]
MECFLAFIFFAFAIAFFVTATTRGGGGRHVTAYRTLAQRYGGVCVTNGVWGRPAARFRYGEVAAHIEAKRNRTLGRHTEAHLQWNDYDFTCILVPAHVQVGWRSAWGLHEVESEDPVFDRQMKILANDPVVAKRLFSEGVRWQVQRLCKLFGDGHVELFWRKGHLTCRKLGWMRTYDELEYFSRVFFELFDQSMLTRVEGIDFLESDGAVAIGDAECQICGEQIVVDMVFCSRCKTPHHSECWEYFGGCSVFGCQESKFITPLIAEPTGDKGQNGTRNKWANKPTDEL